MKNLLFISALMFVLSLSSLPSWARLSDGKTHLKLEGAKIVGTVEKGFHFNKDAPATLTWAEQSTEPLKKTPQELVFDVSKVKSASFVVSFYVCDDQNTVCEAHEEPYGISAGRLVPVTNVVTGSPQKSVTPEKRSQISDQVFGLQRNIHGFYENNLPGALSLADKENKLVLVDFGAPWCPSCIRLETEVFDEKVFKKATAKLIKVSINVDRADAKELSKKYDIKVIPTLVLMNTKGEELARLIDYKPAALIARDIDKLQLQQMASLEDLKKRGEAGDESARRSLGERAFRAVNFAEAVKWLGSLKEPSLILANSEVGLAQEKFEEDGKSAGAAYQKTLEKWLNIYPQTLEAILWRGELLKVMKGEGPEVSPSMKELGQKNVSSIQALLNSAKERSAYFAQTLSGDYTGFEKMELWAQLAANYDLLAEQRQATEARTQLARELSSLKLSEKRPGQVLVALGYMKQANLKDRMVAWYEKLIKAYPQTDVYYSKLARFYVREKQLVKALPWAKKAAAMKSEQSLYNMKTLAEVHRDLNQKKEAVAVVEMALASPEAKLEKNKSNVTALEAIKKTLSQGTKE